MADQSKVDLIRRAAADLFSKLGFEGVAMRDVAKASGVTLATVMYHYKSKQELHAEVSQYSFEEFLAHVLVVHNTVPMSERTPSRLLGVIYDAVMENSTLFYLIQRDMLQLEEGARHTRSRRRYLKFLSVIEKTIAASWGRQPSDTEAMALAAIITGYCELVQADNRPAKEQRKTFVAKHREAMVKLVERQFDTPSN